VGIPVGLGLYKTNIYQYKASIGLSEEEGTHMYGELRKSVKLLR